MNIPKMEIVLLAEIDSLDGPDGCIASNEYFAKFMGLSYKYISEMITNLKRIGLIKQVSFNGRKRVLKSCITEYMADYGTDSMQTTEESVGSLQDNPQADYGKNRIIYNNKENNIENSDITQDSEAVQSERLSVSGRTSSGRVKKNAPQNSTILRKHFIGVYENCGFGYYGVSGNSKGKDCKLLNDWINSNPGLTIPNFKRIIDYYLCENAVIHKKFKIDSKPNIGILKVYAHNFIEDALKKEEKKEYKYADRKTVM
jgi:hypothetical protein